MLSAAQKWRQRIPGAPLHPDLAIAEAQCFLGNPSAAIAQLTPYLPAALKDPQHHANVLVGYTRALTLAGRTEEVAKILTPLLPTTPAWRAHWLSLASAGRRSVQSASQWIETAARYVKPGDLNEQLLLAKTWYDVAQASGDKALHQKVIDLLTPLAKQPDAKATALVMLASSAEQLGKSDVAIENYRRALKEDSNLPFAQNELAYLLVTHNGDAQEAKELASKAVAASPGTAAYHDTLGHAYLKLGDRANAIASLQKAANLDPRNVDTLLALGNALLDDGKADKAAAIADQLGKFSPATLNDSQSKQLQALLARLRQSASQAKGT
jgi:tetratricopeptide (TPR) repeat protein